MMLLSLRCGLLDSWCVLLMYSFFLIVVCYFFIFYFFSSLFDFVFFFFFQAEDGIRDWSVTGVQTCALPISHQSLTGRESSGGNRFVVEETPQIVGQRMAVGITQSGILRHRPQTDGFQIEGRSEERRVGKECRSRW